MMPVWSLSRSSNQFRRPLLNRRQSMKTLVASLSSHYIHLEKYYGTTPLYFASLCIPATCSGNHGCIVEEEVANFVSTFTKTQSSFFSFRSSTGAWASARFYFPLFSRKTSTSFHSSGIDPYLHEFSLVRFFNLPPLVFESAVMLKPFEICT